MEDVKFCKMDECKSLISVLKHYHVYYYFPLLIETDQLIHSTLFCIFSIFFSVSQLYSVGIAVIQHSYHIYTILLWCWWYVDRICNNNYLDDDTNV
jgi:hypothetical protein